MLIKLTRVKSFINQLNQDLSCHSDITGTLPFVINQPVNFDNGLGITTYMYRSYNNNSINNNISFYGRY